MLPERHHLASWHDDLTDGRLAAMTVNLSPNGYKGGVLQLRESRSLSIVNEVANTGYGDAVGAFSVHAYAAVGPQVHENHLFAALPLLVLAAAARPRFVPILAGVSFVLASSMAFYMFSGEEATIRLFPRTLTFIDATLVIAAVNCALLVWHAAVLREETGSPAGGRYVRGR